MSDIKAISFVLTETLCFWPSGHGCCGRDFQPSTYHAPRKRHTVDEPWTSLRIRSSDFLPSTLSFFLCVVFHSCCPCNNVGRWTNKRISRAVVPRVYTINWTCTNHKTIGGVSMRRGSARCASREPPDAADESGAASTNPSFLTKSKVN